MRNLSEKNVVHLSIAALVSFGDVPFQCGVVAPPPFAFFSCHLAMKRPAALTAPQYINTPSLFLNFSATIGHNTLDNENN